jgi:hypothetical protein
MRFCGDVHGLRARVPSTRHHMDDEDNAALTMWIVGKVLGHTHAEAYESSANCTPDRYVFWVKSGLHRRCSLG